MRACLWFFVAVAACQSDRLDLSCEVRGDDGALQWCDEVIGVTPEEAVAFERACLNAQASLPHTFVEGRCPHGGSIGGCALLGSKQNTWYWPIEGRQTPADLQASCTAYLAP